MPLYEITEQGLEERNASGFSALGLREREDIQRLLKSQISALSDDLLVIAEEFGEWEDARRRVDLLAIDRDGQLVVIELKRTDDGGHMELQALRYAAMVSAMSFEDVAATYERHLGDQAGGTARDRLREWLQAQDDEPPAVSSQVRILLVSRDFGKEITTTVLWLNEQYGLDIRCIRLSPYRVGEHVLLDVQQVIPLPEAGDYTVKIRRKEQQQERVLREGRDFTRYQITVDGQEQPSTNKRRSVLSMVRELARKEASLPEIARIIGESHLAVLRGQFSSEDEIAQALVDEGRDPTRWWTDEVFCQGDATYVLSKMWGRQTAGVLTQLSSAFPEANVGFRVADE